MDESRQESRARLAPTTIQRAGCRVVARSPLILLPPSEGKSSGGDGPAWTSCESTPELDGHRRKALTGLRVAMRESASKRGKLLGVGEAATRTATETNRSVELSPTRPAIERYSGVLYQSMNASTMDAAARRRLDSRVVIFSGLWGVVTASDQIPDYKLKMGATLGRLGKISTWWRDRLTAPLNEMARHRVVWDLRPNEHAAAWLIGDTPTQVIAVNFLEERPGRGLVTVSHWNKLLKGVLARNLVSSANPTIDSLADFHFEGFEWEPDSTVEQNGRVETSVVRRI